MTAAVDVACPACATLNPPTRRLCRKCGEPLSASGPTSSLVGPDDDDDRRYRHRRRVAVAAVVVGAVVALGAFLALRQPGEVTTRVVPDTSATTVDPAGPAGEPTVLDPTRVRVEATSTLADEVLSDGTVVRYDAALTLDGDPTTAWNHGSGGDGTGEVFTYTFDQEVSLSHVVIVNGFGISEEVYRRNGRVRGMVVTTDAGRFELMLRDTRMPQQIAGDFGRTRSFRIEVTSVYPAEEFQGRRPFGDLALSEVTFFVGPES